MRDFRLTGLGDGVHALDVSELLRGDAVAGYLVQVTVRDLTGAPAVPLAGTLEVKGALASTLPAEVLPGAAALSLTDRSQWLARFDRLALAKLELGITSLTAGHTVDVLVRGLR